jgi:DNA polymerase-3 subunit epsilon
VSALDNVRLALARRACKLPVQQRLLTHPLPSRHTPVAGMEMLALDFETTGLDTKRDRILSAGWILIRGDRIVMANAREVRVRSETPEGVGQSAVIHGIVDSDLDQAEESATMLEHLFHDLAGRPIVAHASWIERGFLNALLQRLGGIALMNPFICTMALERKLIEGEGGHVREQHSDLTLDACRLRRGLPEHQRHSAGADALATAELFLAQVALLGGANKVSLRDVS